MVKKLDMQTIEQVISQEINPSLDMHGGGIEIIEFDEKNKSLKIKFVGMCLGCPMAQMTFDNLVETSLKKHLPQLKEIILL